MFRKRKVSTPGYGHTPYNPFHGQHATLRQDGISPFCAMVQVAAEDTKENYLICRGFDPRILRFIDYEEGNPNKPGISVAKPFGKRRTGAYEIAEIHTAFLPTQGNVEYTDFHNVTYIPPSPSSVNWRLGQNPGQVDPGVEDGHPEELSDEVNILYDDNGKVINWLLVDSGSVQRDHWVGHLYASYSGAVMGFWVVPSFELDGRLPDGNQWVVNLYKWDFGVAGATIRVEWDHVNDRWIPIQQEYICPDNRTIGPQPPPPPAPPPPPLP